MKKIHVIVGKDDVVSALEELRNLETVHVEHQEELTGYQLAERREEVSVLSKVIDILKSKEAEAHQEDSDDWTEIVNATLKLSAEIAHYQETIAKRQSQIHDWQEWGDFNPKDVEDLRARGIFVQLCAIPASQKIDIPSGVLLEKINTSKGVDHYMAISRSEVKLPFEVITSPSESLTSMKAHQKEEQEKIDTAEKQIQTYVKYLEYLERMHKERQRVLEFEEVEKGMKEDQELALLKGFCPTDACAHLQNRARKEQWALLIEDPGEDDQVPTLLKNPKWVELVKPIFKVIDILPGYKELDVSFVFLVFFSIFFGILVGDAAYGAIFALLTALAHVKLGRKLKDPTVFFLMYILSGCTIVWGFLTGTFFGQAWLPANVKPLVPWLGNMSNVQMLCFLIAAIHLSIAHIWRAILKAPHLTFLAEVGWLALVWTMYFAANMFVLNQAFPSLALVLFIGGMGFVILFTKPNWNPLKSVGAGLGNLAMNFINSFTDVVSYIRLFAVGLATVAVADAFNEMALGVGFGSVAAGIGAALILIFGHVLNIILAGMAILVHGIRLNVLEFSGHLNLEWAGFKYNPFKKR